MRLIEDIGHGDLKLIEKYDSDIPRYAILSHTWGADDDEVTFKDLMEGTGKDKPGYNKIEFCRKQAASDGLQHFWVDTCCIDKSSSAELTEAINSMFRWYQKASNCYVRLSDVSTSRHATDTQSSSATWEAAFRLSRWFRRGWTLQELIAPASVEFFSCEGNQLGSKRSLEQQIHEITGIAIGALRGEPLTDFEVEERLSWAKHRQTKRQEDKAYSLLGIFNVHMSLIYGEGNEKAFVRLREEIDKPSKRNADRAKAENHLVAEDPSIRLEIAEEAAFDATGRDHDPFCLLGTRTDLLHDIRGWLSSDSAKHIYWLSGWAGTGKSTIARTIASECTNPQWQLGSFFFSKGGGDAGHIHKFVGTIATQLSYRWPAFKRALQKAISADKGIVRRTQKAQWTALIQKPLSELLTSASQQRVLLVIDAVDECGADDDMSHIVELLLNAQGVDRTALRIFVTSRPEVAIRNGFDHDPDQHHLNIVLHQISEFVVQNDLFIFLVFHFTKIRERRRLNADWPGDATIHRLVVMSGNLFIWAATVCRFVSKGGRLVKNRLFSILERSHDIGGPEKALDQVYLTVLESAISSDLSDTERKEVSHDFQHILGTIAVLFAPLSVIELGRLLSLEAEEIEQTLADLHSILDVPSDPDCPIRIHHPSFRDFLYDRSRCRNEFLCVDRVAMHSMLADRSFSVMSVLQKDICGLGNPGTVIADVELAVIMQYLSGALQYSCRYWLDHSDQGHGQLSLNDDGPVHRFLREYCLYWLEAMSLIGKISEATTMMMKLASIINEQKAPELQALVRDILRFTHTFGYVLSKAPLQLYVAGLFFSPSHSIVRKLFGAKSLGNINVMTQLLFEWNACIQTLEGHSIGVNSAVFSPDGSRIASGSRDRTVRLWDVQTGQCQQTLEGHSKGVNSVVFSPDGSRVASGSEDRTVRLWDVQTGQCQQTLEGHSKAVTSVAFSPDGSRVASGSEDRTVRLWDVRAGQCQQTLEGHSSAVYSVVFSPDGSRVASSSWDCTVRLWDVQTGQCQQTLEGHSSAVYSVVFSPDGSRVASASRDRTVRVWDVQTGQCQQTLKGHSKAVTSVAFSPDGSRVASSSWDCTVRLWDVQTGQCQQTLEGHSDWVNSVVFSPDGSRVASASRDRTVRVWDVQTGQCQQTLEGHSDGVNRVVFSPDGSRVASGSEDRTVRLWDVQTGQCQQTLEGHSSAVYSVVFSPDGSRVASSSWDCTVRLWDVQTGQCQQTLEGHSSAVYSVVFSPDGSRVASASRDRTVRVWDVQTGQCQQTLKGHSKAVTSVAFSPDGSRVASSSWDCTVRLWDVQTGQCQQTLEGHSDWVNSVVFSPDGSRVASASRDRTVRVWDVQTGQCQQTLEGHSDWVNSVVFSPDGSRVASGSGDHTVRVWDVQTGQCQQTLEGHSSAVYSVVFSPDGSRVASGSGDHTVRVWDVQTGQCQQTLEGHSSAVNSVVFSPDGSRVASGSWDRTVRVWDVTSTTELLRYKTGSSINKAEFTDNSTEIVVNGAVLSVPSQTQLLSTTARTPGTSPILPIGTLGMKDDWITLSSRNFLWLPPEYRPGVWVSKGDTIAIGSGTGRVTFVRYASTYSSLMEQ